MFHPAQAVKLGFGSEFVAARGISQNTGAICTSPRPTSNTNSTLASGTSAATTSHLRPSATWSEVPAPAKILGLAGTYYLLHMQATSVCSTFFRSCTLVLLVHHQLYMTVLRITVHAACATRTTMSACSAGVIPFIALSPPIAASLPLLPAELVQNAALLQVAYGASIASFLGGIHWAMAMAEYGGVSASEHIP